jgi:hypothetical protein
MEQVKIDFAELVKILKEGMPQQMKRFDSAHVSINREVPEPVVEIKNLHVVHKGLLMEIDSHKLLPDDCELLITHCKFEAGVSIYRFLQRVKIISSTFENSLNLRYKADGAGSLEIEDSKIHHLWFYDRSMLNKCIVKNTQFTKLDMSNVSVVGADINFYNTNATQWDLAFKNKPNKIHCDWDMREQIHYAAPTVPLVMTKK